MKPVVSIILSIFKVATIVVAAFVFIVVAVVGLLNVPSIQNKFLIRATEMLEEKLQTKVEIDSIRIGFFRDDVCLYNLRVEDREHRPMLKLELLTAEIDRWALLKKEVQLEEVGVKGLSAQLFKSKSDSVANYQFVLDAFKPKRNVKEKKGEKSGTLVFNLEQLHAEDVDIVYNDSHFSFVSANLSKGWGGRYYAELHKAETSWVHVKKRHPVRVDNHLMIGRVVYEEEDGLRKVAFDSVQWTTNNHLPHKRTNKPKRGWFDDGHLDVAANMKFNLRHADKDSVCGTLEECDIHDKASGLHITDLHLKFKKIAEKIQVSDATVCMANTKLTFNNGQLQLPSKKEGRPLHFSTSKITGRTLLKDISHPFAPVLKDFKEPLLVSTRFSGNDNSLAFKDVVVRTTDNMLHIKAVGGLNNLKDKYKLRVHFNILDCVAKGDSKTRIINQFRVRKFMMKQVQTLGTLHYKGALDVLYKKIQLRGRVGTDCGHMQVVLLVNSLDKYLTGNVQSNDLELGKAMDHPEWGRVDCMADFKIDISKVRTAAMRRQKGGKLPIGQADAIVNETKFKGIKLTGIHATIVSDGALAEGRLTRQGKLSELFCAFSFTDTNDMKKMKIKPGIHLNIFHPKKDKKKGSA